MSYRSFKHVLGETSLERKCRFLFGACLLLLITGSFWWYGKQTEQLVDKQNRNKGRLLVDTVVLLSHWKEIDVDEGNEDAQFFIDEFGARLQTQEYRHRSIRPPTSNPSRKPSEEPQDPFERELIRRWMESQPPPATPGDESQVEYAERYVADRAEYQYYQAVRAESTCIICHKTLDPNPNMYEGDLLRIVQVSIPAGPTQRDLNRNRAILMATAIITVFLAMLAAYVIVRYVIVKPLKHLQDVSNAISHGNIDTRAEIYTGDEFEQLGHAFNRMLRHLIAAQEELQSLNADLDFKVDQLAQANLQLFELNRLKSDFLATMSHELRTPLNSILGFSDVLGSNQKLDDRQQRYVKNIQKSGKMLLDLINDILDLAKIESGKMELHLSDFRMEHVVSAQCDMARPLADKKNIDLETYVETGLPEVRQDQGKVQQILNNLLSNAVKFTPEGGRILVRVRRVSDSEIELIVTDTGVGIAEEDQTAIFEKFRQGRTVLVGGDAMTREYSGTGLGLSIVKELCRLLGGEIFLTSELGKGSTFTIRLPIRMEQPPPSEVAMAPSLETLNVTPHLLRPPAATSTPHDGRDA